MTEEKSKPCARTRVEFEHRREEMRTIFDTMGDRGRLLAAFAETAAATGRTSK
ncbi:MAG: hypothetical protein ACREUT_14090 [Steroidobacteraceae bacterium]